MESLPNQLCPRCGRTELNVYYATSQDEKLGAWCESCNLRAYYDGRELVSMKEWS